jgi:hypothetical protein
LFWILQVFISHRNAPAQVTHVTPGRQTQSVPGTNISRGHENAVR